MANVLIDGKLKDPLIKGYMTVMETTGCKTITAAFPKWIAEKFNFTYQALYRCGKEPVHAKQ